MAQSDSSSATVLVAGATGFIGRHLCEALADSGHRVVAMTRHPDGYRGPGTAVAGDVADPDSLARALQGIDVAYYLVHTLDSADFEGQDREAARSFGREAARAGVQQVVYLGGLGRGDLSPHLRSRREVEALLAEGGAPVTALRAAIVVGHGSVSWEMTRELVEHLPAMVAPRWVDTRCQPIAVADVVRYLVGVLGREETYGQAFEVGGADVLTYREMMQQAARILHGRALPVVVVPVMTPRLSSAWLSLVTSVDVTTGRNLMESMDTEVVVHNDAITRIVPFEPMGYSDMVRVAARDRLDDDEAFDR